MEPYGLCCEKKGAHDGLVSAVACTESFVFTGGGTLRSTLKIWCLDGDELSHVGTSTICVGSLISLKVAKVNSPQTRLVGVTNMSYVYVWDVSPDVILKSSSDESISPILEVQPKHLGECSKADILQDGMTLVCAGSTPGRGIYFLSIDTGERLANFNTITVQLAPSQGQRAAESLSMWQFTGLTVDSHRSPHHESMPDGRWLAVADSMGNVAFIFIENALLELIHSSYAENSALLELTQNHIRRMVTLHAFERSVQILDIAWRPRSAESRSLCASLAGSNGFACTCFITPSGGSRKTFNITANKSKVVAGHTYGRLNCITYGYDSNHGPVIVAGASTVTTADLCAPASYGGKDTSEGDGGAAAQRQRDGNFVVRCQLASDEKETFVTIGNHQNALTSIAVSGKRAIIASVGLDGNLCVFKREAKRKSGASPRHSSRKRKSHRDKHQRSSTRRKHRKRIDEESQTSRKSEETKNRNLSKETTSGTEMSAASAAVPSAQKDVESQSNDHHHSSSVVESQSNDHHHSSSVVESQSNDHHHSSSVVESQSNDHHHSSSNHHHSSVVEEEQLDDVLMECDGHTPGVVPTEGVVEHEVQTSEFGGGAEDDGLDDFMAVDDDADFMDDTN